MHTGMSPRSLSLRLARLVDQGILDKAARAGAPAEMHGNLDAAHAADDFVDHVGGKRRCGVRVGVFRAHGGVNEQAKMRVVNLRDVRAGVAHQFQFAPQDRHAGAHEIVPLRIGFLRTPRVPQPLAEQRRQVKPFPKIQFAAWDDHFSSLPITPRP